MKHGVVADEVGERKRTDGVVHPEFHDAVDGIGLRHTFLQREDGFVDHRAQDTVGNKTWGIVARQGRFAHLFRSLYNGRVRSLAGVSTVDDFNEFHDGNGVHEMHADDLVGTVGGCRNRRDGNGGCVGGQNGFGLAQAVQFGEDFLLQGENLRDGLDHQVAFGAQRTVGAGGDAGEGRISVFLTHALLAHKFAQRELNGAEAFLDVFVFDVDHHNIVTGTRRHLCNAVAHLSCTNHAN